MTGIVILAVALVAATAFGLYRAATDGRFSGTRDVRGAQGLEASDASAATSADADAADSVNDEPTLGADELGEPLGERATLVQFSSSFCAPCRVARRVLGEVAGEEDGVRHIEIDAESHLELVRSVGVMRTPTTLVLDAAGREVARASGAPTKDQVRSSLAALA